MIALAIAAAAAALAAGAPPPDPLVAQVGLDEHVGAALPLALRFADTTGAPHTLADVVTPGDGRPTLLVMAYARCTMLCSVVLRGVAESVRASHLAPGRDFHLVVVSLDPRETPDEGARRQASLLAALDRTGDRSAWPYLVGAPEDIDALAHALGFRYAWDARTEQYAHPAVVFVLTPGARIAEYLRGVRFPDPILADALARAAQGQLTTDAAQDVVRCFHFDPALRAHQARIQAFFRLGAGLVFGALATLVVALLLWERRRRACST